MLDEALSKVKRMLAADGYELAYEQAEGGRVDIFIKAGHGACAECLVSKPVLEDIVSSALAEEGVWCEELNINMPD